MAVRIAALAGGGVVAKSDRYVFGEQGQIIGGGAVARSNGRLAGSSRQRRCAPGRDAHHHSRPLNRAPAAPRV